MRVFLTLFPAFLLSFFRHQHHFLSWAWRISKASQKTGCRACELMLRDPARFEAPVVFCDIPKTRTYYLKRVGMSVSCAKGRICRPHHTLPMMAREETIPAKAPRQKRPRGAWTATFRKSPT